MCAGITTYNALRNSGARVGDVVAILGVGEVGHLRVQFASKRGLDTVAIARGKDKVESAKKLGTKHYIDSQSQNCRRGTCQIRRCQSQPCNCDKCKSDECSSGWVSS